MDFLIHPMDRTHALDIANWAYEAPYDFYNMDDSEDTMKELLSGAYFYVTDRDQTMIGYFCSGKAAEVPSGHQYGAYAGDDVLDVGLGLRPDLTGQGIGSRFFSAILAFLEGEHGAPRFRLTVAAFNLRAIKLYEKLGFVRILEFPHSCVNFLTMVRDDDLYRDPNGKMEAAL